MRADGGEKRFGGMADRQGRPRAHDRRAGFGVVEALVAVVILGVGLLAVAGLVMGFAVETRRTATETRRILVGQQVLEEQVGRGYSETLVGARDTLVSSDGEEYRVRMRVTQSAPRVREVEVVVEGSEQPARRDTLATRLHGP